MEWNEDSLLFLLFQNTEVIFKTKPEKSVPYKEVINT